MSNYEEWNQPPELRSTNYPCVVAVLFLYPPLEHEGNIGTTYDDAPLAPGAPTYLSTHKVRCAERLHSVSL